MKKEHRLLCLGGGGGRHFETYPNPRTNPSGKDGILITRRSEWTGFTSLFTSVGDVIVESAETCLRQQPNLPWGCQKQRGAIGALFVWVMLVADVTEDPF